MNRNPRIRPIHGDEAVSEHDDRTDAERRLLLAVANTLLVLLARTEHHDLMQTLMTARQAVNTANTSSAIGHG